MGELYLISIETMISSNLPIANKNIIARVIIEPAITKVI
nr:MAG TPA: hypothetical protein [Bacteriophage sp.]